MNCTHALWSAGSRSSATTAVPTLVRTRPAKGTLPALLVGGWMALCTPLAGASEDAAVPHFLSVNALVHAQGSAIDQQLARIAELESRDSLNSWAPGLGEAWLDLANTQAAAGDYNAALTSYGKALQVVRVRDGLSSANQLPILQAQLRTLEKLQQWNRYDSTLNLINLITQDHFPVGDDNRIKVLDQLSKWQLRAAREGLLERSEEKTRAVADLYASEMQKLENDDSTRVSDFGISSLRIGIANTRLALTQIIFTKPVKEYRSLAGELMVSGSNCRATPMTIGNDSAACLAPAIPNLGQFREPARRKQRELNFYLEELRTSILDAGETLSEKPHFENREQLVDEFRNLAESYTEFVSLAKVN